MSSKTLPVNKDPNFIGEFEKMDLAPLYDKLFFIGASTGDREKGGILVSSIKGPYDFYEMVEEVGTMWREQLHHAKVYLCSKERNKRNQFLDTNTIDYIEANYQDLIMYGLLADQLDHDADEFTCTAGVNEMDESDEE